MKRIAHCLHHCSRIKDTTTSDVHSASVLSYLLRPTIWAISAVTPACLVSDSVRVAFVTEGCNVQYANDLLLCRTTSVGPFTSSSILQRFYTASTYPAIAMQMPCLSCGRGVCPSVCLFVCPSQSAALSKRRKLGSRNLHCQVHKGLYYQDL